MKLAVMCILFGYLGLPRIIDWVIPEQVKFVQEVQQSFQCEIRDWWR